MDKFFGDLKHLRAPSQFSEGQIVGWCAACFVMGAACAVVVLFSLSTWGM